MHELLLSVVGRLHTIEKELETYVDTLDYSQLWYALQLTTRILAVIAGENQCCQSIELCFQVASRTRFTVDQVASRTRFTVEASASATQPTRMRGIPGIVQHR